MTETDTERNNVANHKISITVCDDDKYNDNNGDHHVNSSALRTETQMNHFHINIIH